MGQNVVVMPQRTPSVSSLFGGLDTRLDTILLQESNHSYKAIEIVSSGRIGPGSERIHTTQPADGESSDMTPSIEERLENRIERMSDELRREMRLREKSARREAHALNKALQAHVESNNAAVASTLAALERVEKEFGTVKQANKEQRYWMAGIGVAIVLGIMGANATIFMGGKSFFDGGKEASETQSRVETLIQESKAQGDANRRLLEEIIKQRDSSASQSTKP